MFTTSINSRICALGAAIALSTTVATPAPAEAPGEIVGTVTAAVAKHRANTVVYVKNAGLGTSTGTAKMDQKGLMFAPRVLPIQKGTTVEFVNSDPVGHSVFTLDGEKYDLGTWPKGDSRKYQFTNSGVYRQMCRVHDDMIAFIVVLETQYFGMSDKSGEFKIRALPPGKYTLGVWNEKLGASDVDVEVTAGGSTKIEIPLAAK